MRKESLSSLCKIINGYAFKSTDYTGTGYRVIRITNVQKGIVVDNDPKFIPEVIADKADSSKLMKNDILISLTGNVGRVGRIDEQLLPAVLNQRVGLIRINTSKLDDKYLFQYLNSDTFENEAINNSNGVAQLNLSSKWVEKHQIPLPPLDDQKRIAHLLGKVEGMIAQRKQHLQQLDELLKSVFLEMFGDPVRNEKGWEKKPLENYMKEFPNNGLYKPQSDYGSGTKIVRIDSFYDGYVQNIDLLKLVKVTDDEYERFNVKTNDILINRVNSIEYLGKLGVMPQIKERIVYESNMMRFRLETDSILPVFLMFIWRTPFIKAQINNRAKKAVNQASVNQKDVRSIVIVKPPITLQKQFAAIVEKVESLKSRYQSSLTNLENLYGVLSQKAFKGELDLSRVPMEEETR
jgi:type I restriction enzyme S subunit